ncbi:fatty acyl-CoA reductase [Marinobacter sp. LN3S78]|uniref:fatty acyl-CoA reductase n=1 Tax=Marinobacter sp. LN3S78 TaxID=3382300 RepID=UPI00387B92A3
MTFIIQGSEEIKSLTLERFKGKRLLITGATGFVGKVVLEKLLRCVPDVGGIFLLIRANSRYRNSYDRFCSEILSSSVFDRLRAEKGEQFGELVSAKVHCVTGNVTENRFGLSAAKFVHLANKIDAVINAAASVNFREELDKALEVNTLCLKNIVMFSSCGSGIPVLQVSTCYVNGKNSGHATERVVAPAGAEIPKSNHGYYDVGGLLRRLQDKIDDIRSRYVGTDLARRLIDLGLREANHYGWSDTYTFTKWLGEQLLMEGLQGQNLTIVRPSIIESALEEPAPGWLEGIKVADAIILAYAREKVSLFPGRRRSVLDIIPVDLVANSIILCLAEALDDKQVHRIYQCCSGSSNPVTLGEFIDHIITASKRDYRLHDRLFYRRPTKPFIAVNRRLFNVAVGCVRFSLSVASRTLKTLGRPDDMRMLRNLDTTRSLATIFGFYTSPNYIFRNDRLMELADRMGTTDRNLFPIDPGAIQWPTYIERIHMAGLNRFALGGLSKPQRKDRKFGKTV